MIITVIILIAFNIITLVAGYFILVRRIEKRLVNNRVLESIKKEINAMIIQLNETTIQNIGLLEERVKRVHKLMTMADRKINDLDSAVTFQDKKKEPVPIDKLLMQDESLVEDKLSSESVTSQKKNIIDIKDNNSGLKTFKDLFSQNIGDQNEDITYTPKKIVKQMKKEAEINDKDQKLLEEVIQLDALLASLSVPERVRYLGGLGWDRKRIQKKTGLSPGELELLLNIEETLSD